MRYCDPMANTNVPDANSPPPGPRSSASANVRAEIARRHSSAREVQKATGIPPSTWNRRMSDPSTWRLGELQRIAEYLDVPLDRLADGVDR